MNLTYPMVYKGDHVLICLGMLIADRQVLEGVQVVSDLDQNGEVVMRRWDVDCLVRHVDLGE
jgi:hypothetical protein